MQRRWFIVASMIFSWVVILFASPFPTIFPLGVWQSESSWRLGSLWVAQVATEKLQASGARRSAAGKRSRSLRAGHSGSESLTDLSDLEI